MNFIGDYFAVALVVILGMFFFDGKHSLNRTSRYFVACLLFTAASALTDIATGVLLGDVSRPLWMHMAVNALYFLLKLQPEYASRPQPYVRIRCTPRSP